MPLDTIILKLKKIIPSRLVDFLLPAYHCLWAFLPALYYRFPARKINVIFITGTKGKTTTAELVNAVIQSGGYRTALASTLRFKIFDKETRNNYKMSVPGRGILQKFLHDAVNEGCDFAIMEMSSQAVLNYRNQWLFPNVLVFTNLEPEHIEAHGSYENYLEAKLKLADQLKSSIKFNKAIVANLDDKEGKKFVSRAGFNNIRDYGFALKHISRPLLKGSIRFSYKDQRFVSPLLGMHNLKNILAAIKVGEFYNISHSNMIDGINHHTIVKGRLEKVASDKHPKLEVYVDYAHTPGSLEAVYETFKDKKIVAILGNAGGGRDVWKRTKMAEIANTYCHKIILTDEDPYDEDPRSIVETMYQAIEKKDITEIEMDRRIAINKALNMSKEIPNSVVLITGKGTDPYIMRANGVREPWDDATIVCEELEKI